MQSIIVELNGRVKELSLSDLRSLVDKGLVDMSTPVCVEGEDCVYSDISLQVESGADYVVPSNNQVISVEIDGKLKSVSLEQLKELNRLGFLRTRTRIDIDGKSFHLNQLASQLDSDLKRIKVPKKYKISSIFCSRERDNKPVKERTEVCEMKYKVPRSWGNDIATCMTRKYFKFSGRADRREFGSFALFFCFIRITLITIGFVCESYHITELTDSIPRMCWAFVSVLALILFWFVQIPYITVSVRRIHDTGHSGLLIFPYILSILSFAIIPNCYLLLLNTYFPILGGGYFNEGLLAGLLNVISGLILIPTTAFSVWFESIIPGDFFSSSFPSGKFCIGYISSLIIPVFHFIIFFCWQTKR